MLKWAFTLAVLGAIAAAGAWYPIHGKTVLERWHGASGAVDFAERSAAEAKTALGFGTPARRTEPSKVARRKAAPQKTERPPHPTESHTDEDRAALDRLLAEHARR